MLQVVCVCEYVFVHICVSECVVFVCVCMLQTWERIHKPMHTKRQEEDVNCYVLSISTLRLKLSFNLSLDGRQ